MQRPVLWMFAPLCGRHILALNYLHRFGLATMSVSPVVDMGLGHEGEEGTSSSAATAPWLPSSQAEHALIQPPGTEGLECPVVSATSESQQPVATSHHEQTKALGPVAPGPLQDTLQTVSSQAFAAIAEPSDEAEASHITTPTDQAAVAAEPSSGLPSGAGEMPAAASILPLEAAVSEQAPPEAAVRLAQRVGACDDEAGSAPEDSTLASAPEAEELRAAAAPSLDGALILPVECGQEQLRPIDSLGFSKEGEESTNTLSDTSVAGDALAGAPNLLAPGLAFFAEHPAGQVSSQDPPGASSNDDEILASATASLSLHDPAHVPASATHEGSQAASETAPHDLVGAPGSEATTVGLASEAPGESANLAPLIGELTCTNEEALEVLGAMVVELSTGLGVSGEPFEQGFQDAAAVPAPGILQVKEEDPSNPEEQANEFVAGDSPGKRRRLAGSERGGAGEAPVEWAQLLTQAAGVDEPLHASDVKEEAEPEEPEDKAAATEEVEADYDIDADPADEVRQLHQAANEKLTRALLRLFALPVSVVMDVFPADPAQARASITKWLRKKILSDKDGWQIYFNLYNRIFGNTPEVADLLGLPQPLVAATAGAAAGNVVETYAELDLNIPEMNNFPVACEHYVKCSDGQCVPLAMEPCEILAYYQEALMILMRPGGLEAQDFQDLACKVPERFRLKALLNRLRNGGDVTHGLGRSWELAEGTYRIAMRDFPIVRTAVKDFVLSMPLDLDAETAVALLEVWLSRPDVVDVDVLANALKRCQRPTRIRLWSMFYLRSKIGKDSRHALFPDDKLSRKHWL